MKKIAIISDDVDLLTLMKYAVQEDFQTVGISPGEDAVSRCLRERPDLILLDIILPNSEGANICKRLRACGDMVTTPILLVSTPTTEIDRIFARELGASDLIVRPFLMSELIARIEVQLRNAVNSTCLLNAAGLELDQAKCRVRLNRREIHLTATEFRLLEFLMTRPEVVFTREELLATVWGNNPSVTKQIVDVYVLRLRRKFRTGAIDNQFIRAVRGFGYSFASKLEVRERMQTAL